MVDVNYGDIQMLNVLVKSLGEDIARFAADAQQQAEKLSAVRAIVSRTKETLSAGIKVHEAPILLDELMEELETALS